MVAGRISRLEVDGDRVSGARLDDGHVVAVDVVVVSTRMVACTNPFAGIGIEPTSHPAGAFIESVAFGKTAVPGVWAAGNASDISAQVSGAAAEGARAASTSINADLVMDDDLNRAMAARADAPADVPADEGHAMTHSFDSEYWDQIWHGDRAASMAASQPNPHLIQEVGDLAAGTAIDAGCGAGAEAIWLATHGWQVTAADIATEALARAAERAGASGVAGQVEWVQADLSTWDPDTRYDLVTTHYAHSAMPQLEFYDRIATWVAPGGTLLIVGHLHHDAAGSDGHGHGHEQSGDGAPASASATAAAITARLDPAVWEVVTAQESHRTLSHGGGGREATLHDVVVRATRHP